MAVCDICVEIRQITEAMGDENIRLKRTNKILRTVNGMLRRDKDRQHEAQDDIFVALCATDHAAELAMGELWGSGEFDCGPQDYIFMVERCLEALCEYNERRTKSAPAFHSDRDLGDESGY